MVAATLLWILVLDLDAALWILAGDVPATLLAGDEAPNVPNGGKLVICYLTVQWYDPMV